MQIYLVRMRRWNAYSLINEFTFEKNKRQVICLFPYFLFGVARVLFGSSSENDCHRR